MSAKNIHIKFTKLEVRIVVFIFKHYKDRFNPRQLARLMCINHAHATKLCNLLVEKNLLVKEQIGISVYFSFDYDNKYAVSFIVYLLSLEWKFFPKYLLVVRHALSKLCPDIEMGFVFGSSIKTKNYNDIDVLLLYENSKLKEVKKIKDNIRKSQILRKPVRYVEISGKDIGDFRKEQISYGILSESLIFCGSEVYVKVILECHRQKST